MSTPLYSASDGHIRIYEMSGGGQGNEQSPSGGWLYVEGITINDTAKILSVPRLGTTGNRHVRLGSTASIQIEKIHTSDNYFGLAFDETKEYIIEAQFYDEQEGETDVSAHKVVLSFCVPADRTHSGSKQNNTMVRKWVGNITTDTYVDTSTMSWNVVIVSSQTSGTVNHNLGYYPNVYFIDTVTGKRTRLNEKHTSKNSFTWAAKRSKTGEIIYG